MNRKIALKKTKSFGSYFKKATNASISLSEHIKNKQRQQLSSKGPSRFGHLNTHLEQLIEQEEEDTDGLSFDDIDFKKKN